MTPIVESTGIVGRPDPARWRAILGRIRLLQGCPTAHLAELVRVARFCSHPAESIIFAQNEAADEVYIVVSGRVRLLISNDNGRELSLAQLKREEVFGEAALLVEGRHASTAVAVDDVQLVAIGRSALLAHMRTQPAAGAVLTQQLTERLGTAHRRLGEVTLQHVEERVVRELERLALKDGEMTESGLVLHNRPTHQQLANQIGISRETLTRTLTALSKRSLLVARGNWLKLSPALLELKSKNDNER